MKKEIVHNFFIANPVNFMMAYEIIKKEKFKRINLFFINQTKTINEKIFDDINVEKNKIFLSKKITNIFLTISSLFKLFMHNSNNNINFVYYGDYKWNFLDLINYFFKPKMIFIIDDGLDSIFFEDNKKLYGFRKNYFLSKFLNKKIKYINNLYIPKKKKIYFFQKKFNSKKINKRYNKIFLGSAACSKWLNKKAYYNWIKNFQSEENFFYFPHRKENIEEIMKFIPKNKIILLNESFEIFYLNLYSKPKKIISFSSTSIYFVRLFNTKQKIIHLSFKNFFKKKDINLNDEVFLLENKIFSFLEKILN